MIKYILNLERRCVWLVQYHVFFNVLYTRTCTVQPPSKRPKIATSEDRITSWRSNWGFRGRFHSAWNTLVGGVRRIFRWRRQQEQQQPATALEEGTTNMDYDDPRPNALVPSQHLSSPIFTSTPSQSLTQMTSIPSVDVPGASRVGTPPVLDNLTHSSRISSTSGQANDQTHLETHSDEQLYLVTEKRVAQKTLKERELSNKRLSRPEQQVAQKTLKERECLHGTYLDERLSQTEKQVAQKTLKESDQQEEDWPLRAAQRLTTGQPLRPGVNVDHGGGMALRGEKQLETCREENLQKSSIPRTSVGHTSAVRSVGSSYNTMLSRHSTPASQSTRKPLYSLKQAHRGDEMYNHC